MRAPLVSIAMPVRNGMPFLPAALESLLAQTHRELDILVVDDGSTDDSPRYVSSLRDSRVRVLPNDGRGLVAALNTAIAEAHGELVARHDADDLSTPDRIARQVQYLREHPDVDVVACAAEFIDAASQRVVTPQTDERRRLQREAARPGRLRQLLPLTCCVVHGAVMARRHALAAVGGYRESHGSAEDYDLWLRLLDRHTLAMLPEVLYAHRLHDGQVSERLRTERLLGTLRTKLDHLRAAAPRLPRPARTVIAGDGVGARMYASLGDAYDLTVVAPDADDDAVDLTIVANYTDADGRLLDIEAGPGWSAYGNFLVRETWR